MDEDSEEPVCYLKRGVPTSVPVGCTRMAVTPEFPDQSFNSSTTYDEPQWAALEILFDVRDDGHTENIRVITADAKKGFVRSGVEAVEKWLYRPVEEDPLPDMRKDKTAVFMYRLVS